MTLLSRLILSKDYSLLMILELLGFARGLLVVHKPCGVLFIGGMVSLFLFGHYS